MKSKKFVKSNNKVHLMDLTPLIDVVFLLLIFFMVATTFSEFTAMNIDLPTSDTQEVKVDNIEKIRVLIDKDKNIIVRLEKNHKVEDLPVMEIELKNELNKILNYSNVKGVNLVAHKELDYGYIVQLIGEIKEAGATGLNIEIEKSN